MALHHLSDHYRWNPEKERWEVRETHGTWAESTVMAEQGLGEEDGARWLGKAGWVTVHEYEAKP